MQHIKDAISSFPETFGLKAFSGRYYIEPAHCYESGNTIYLYVFRLDTREAFCKCTPDELRRAVVI